MCWELSWVTTRYRIQPANAQHDDMSDIISGPAVAALLQVIMIDLVLAGDNAVVIGLATASLPPEQRRRAIIIGILAATVLRIAFASVATQLLQIIGLLLAGGILLLWVCWKMWRELRATSQHEHDDVAAGRPPRKTFAQATWQIVVADVSMSLDNVLAVAGAAREHPYVLAFGLLVRRTDGDRRKSPRPADPEAPLDRLCRTGGDPLRGLRDDLSRRARSEARDRSGRTDC
jgi:YjbE family integral membrane protein